MILIFLIFYFFFICFFYFFFMLRASARFFSRNRILEPFSSAGLFINNSSIIQKRNYCEESVLKNLGGKADAKFNDSSAQYELLAMNCAANGDPETIEDILEKMKAPSINIFNCLIRSYIASDQLSRIAFVFETLEDPEKPDPNEESFIPLMINYLQEGEVLLARNVLFHAMSYGAAGSGMIKRYVESLLDFNDIEEVLLVIRCMELAGIFDEDLYKMLFSNLSFRSTQGYELLKRYFVYHRDSTFIPIQKEQYELLTFSSVHSENDFDCYYLTQFLLDKYPYFRPEIPDLVLRHLLVLARMTDSINDVANPTDPVYEKHIDIEKRLHINQNTKDPINFDFGNGRNEEYKRIQEKITSKLPEMRDASLDIFSKKLVEELALNHMIDSDDYKDDLNQHHEIPEGKAVNDKIRILFYRCIARGFRFSDENVNELIAFFYGKGDYENVFRIYEIMKRDAYNVYPETYAPAAKAALVLGTNHSIKQIPDIILNSIIEEPQRIALLQLVVETAVDKSNSLSLKNQLKEINDHLQEKPIYNYKLYNIMVDYHLSQGDIESAKDLTKQVIKRIYSEKLKNSSYDADAIERQRTNSISNIDRELYENINTFTKESSSYPELNIPEDLTIDRPLFKKTYDEYIQSSLQEKIKLGQQTSYNIDGEDISANIANLEKEAKEFTINDEVDTDEAINQFRETSKLFPSTTENGYISPSDSRFPAYFKELRNKELSPYMIYNPRISKDNLLSREDIEATDASNLSELKVKPVQFKKPSPDSLQYNTNSIISAPKESHNVSQPFQLVRDSLTSTGLEKYGIDSTNNEALEPFREIISNLPKHVILEEAISKRFQKVEKDEKPEQPYACADINIVQARNIPPEDVSDHVDELWQNILVHISARGGVEEAMKFADNLLAEIAFAEPPSETLCELLGFPETWREQYEPLDNDN